MADVPVKLFRASSVRPNTSPTNPSTPVGEEPIIINPPGTPSGEYVPYTGATDNVDLGEKGLRSGYYRFDTTPTATPTDQGTMYWDEDDNTVDIVLNGYIMKVGEDQFYPVKNQTGSNIPKGTSVRFAGTVGSSGRLLIAPFLADGSLPSTRFMGVTAEAIANGEDGKVLWFGRLRGINTSAFAEGDILYASTTVAGGFQTTVPTAPNNIVEIAAVVTDASNGTIFIRPQFIQGTSSSETVEVVSTSGTINDLSTTASTVVFTGATVTLTGIVGLANGTERTLVNLTGSNLTISYLSASSAAANRFFFSHVIPNRGVVTIKYSTNASNVWLMKSGVFTPNNDATGAYSNQFIGIGRLPASNIGLTLRSVSNTDTAFALATERLDGTRTFEIRSLSSISYVPMGIGGVSAGSTRALTIRSLATGGWPLEIFNFAGVSTTLFFNSGDIGMTQGIIMGAASSFSTPTARLDVRGRGTTTGLTQIWEDSAGTDNVQFIDNGQIRFLRLPTSSAGLAVGSLWNDGGTLKIVT